MDEAWSPREQRITATDPDGNDSAITFTIIEGNPYRGNLFRVADKGRVTYQGGGEDYESFPDGQARYMLTVTATDGRGATASVSVTIDIGDVAE